MSRIFVPVWFLAIILLSGSSLAQEDDRAMGRVTVEILVEDGSVTREQLYAESYALIIGVSNYTAGWPPLPGVREDIAAVHPALKAQGFQVEIVTDPDADMLREAFRSFIARHGLKEDARLLFYFAGHGHTRTRSYGEDMGYVVPTDAPDPEKDPTGFFAKAIDMEQIQVYARQIESRHALFLFDSCFSGSLFALTRAREVPPAISDKTSKPVRQFITSGAAEQTVPDKSIFRMQFVEALNGAGDLNADGFLTGAELGSFLHERVVNYTRNAQTPQYGKIRDPYLDKGDFVFALPGGPRTSTRQQLQVAVPTISSEELMLGAAKTAFQIIVDIDKNEYVDHQEKAPKWQEYLDKFQSTGFQVAIARERLTYWQNYVPPTPSPSPTPRPPKPGEAARAMGASYLDTEEEGRRIRIIDLQGLAAIRLVWIPPGEYTMGSPQDEKGRDEAERQVIVDIAQGFWLGETEITQAQWQAVMGTKISKFRGDDFPVENVTWDDAVAFCLALRDLLGGKHQVRLPTEAQWEYACRAGSDTMYSFGDSSFAIKDYAWYASNSGGRTNSVATRKANGFGLYDMHGNVWEWCLDWYGSYPSEPVRDWVQPDSGTRRIYRGGSWSTQAVWLRCATRGNGAPNYKYSDIGFRILMLDR